MRNFKYYNHDPKMSKQTLVTEDILLFPVKPDFGWAYISPANPANQSKKDFHKASKKQLLDDLTHDLLGIVCL